MARNNESSGESSCALPCIVGEGDARTEFVRRSLQVPPYVKIVTDVDGV